MIRLSTLTPDSVTKEVSEWMSGHLATILFAIGAAPESLHIGGDLIYSVRALTHYAQTGELPGDTPAAGYIQSVVEPLYRAAHPEVYSAGDWQRRTGDLRYGIDCVVRACLARDAIARGERVPIGWLCALVELPVQTLRTYASRGEITVRDGEMTAKEARRWLGARGVAGFREVAK